MRLVRAAGGQSRPVNSVNTMSHQVELTVLGVLVAVVGLLLLAGRTRIPYPILLVLGGLAIGFVPGITTIELPPDLVLLIFLPPLLYGASFFSSLRDLRANLREISLLSVGLVLATVVSVAVVAHAVAGLPWAVAFVLGAIVSPTDPVAATSIASRLGVPRRVVTIIEGESLINDGTALVAYRFALGAVLSGSFSLWLAGIQFVLSAIGGVAIGLLTGYVVASIRRRLDNPLVEITISLVTAYFAYLPAEALGVSGVLAAVTVGIYMGWRAPELITPSTRIQAFSIWEILTFLLNTALFVLIGLQLRPLLEGLAGESPAQLALYAAAVVAAVIGTRIVWVFVLTYLPRRVSAKLRERDPSPPWQLTFLVSWTGLRGAVSLAAALAIPQTLASGEPFPGRDLIIFLTFCVIVATLVFQGLSLPPLIRALDLEDDDSDRREETEARLRAAEAAIGRIDELAGEEWVRDGTADRLRGLYDYRRRRFATLLGETDGQGDETDYEGRTGAFMRLRMELLQAERDTLVRMRNERRISDEVLRRVERDLDLEEARLEG